MISVLQHWSAGKCYYWRIGNCTFLERAISMKWKQLLVFWRLTWIRNASMLRTVDSLRILFLRISWSQSLHKVKSRKLKIIIKGEKDGKREYRQQSAWQLWQVTACSVEQKEKVQAGGKQQHRFCPRMVWSEDIFQQRRLMLPWRSSLTARLWQKPENQWQIYCWRQTVNHDYAIELSQAMAAKGAEEGLLETIDLSKIEHASDLIAGSKDAGWQWSGVPYILLTVLGLCITGSSRGLRQAFDDLWKPELAGMVSIRHTTFGPAMVYMASDHGVDIKTDNERLLLRHWRN